MTPIRFCPIGRPRQKKTAKGKQKETLREWVFNSTPNNRIVCYGTKVDRGTRRITFPKGDK